MSEHESTASNLWKRVSWNQTDDDDEEQVEFNLS